MKNYSNLQKVKIILLLFVMCLIYSNSSAQCNISVSKSKSCRGMLTQFSIPSSTSYSSIKWDFGNGDSSLQPTNTISYIYDTFGAFVACVTLYNSDGSIKCGPSCIPITVYDNPNAGLIRPSKAKKCFENNSFCFNDNSSLGKNNSPIVHYVWDFGDGDSSSSKNPCKSYLYSGLYQVMHMVIDANNCWDTITDFKGITVYPEINPDFTTHFQIHCPETEVTFTNNTDSTGQGISDWTWDFDDGTIITTNKDTAWGKPSFTYTYKKDGTFNPKLIIRTKNGCVDSFKRFSGAKNIFYYFDIQHQSSPPYCFDNNNICFTAKPRRNAYYLLWTFDDPPSRLNNTNDGSWSPCHKYTAPGNYHIKLQIYEPNCIRDTIYCAFIPIYGPKAMILMPSAPAFPENNQIQAKPIPASYWHSMSSTCKNPNKDSVVYVTRSTIIPFKIGQIDSFCNSLLDSTNFLSHYKSYLSCPGKDVVYYTDFPLLSSPVSSIIIYDSIKETSTAWYPGDAIPSGVQYGTVYFPKSGSINSQTMHDSDLYIENCSGPNYVRFTNNSIKHRMYYAIDDNPLLYFPHYALQQGGGTSPDMRIDQCYNPSYPWASDSMQYFWDFGDNYAKPCTSTVNFPDMECKWSTEIQPWHLYKNDGCFDATLSVEDPVTNCSSDVTVKIIMEKPNAGWDINKFGLWKGNAPAMDYQTQMITKPNLGNRGVILSGTPCAGTYYPQIPIFNETSPSCGRQNWWMVFDSAAYGYGGCGDTSSICSDQTRLDFDGDAVNESVVNHNTTKCFWVDQVTFMMMANQWVYGDGGWKTIGLIIKTGDCYDTFFYHDYKYIADLNNRFELHDPDSFNSVTGTYPIIDYYQTQKHLRLCQNHQLIITTSDKSQKGITSFTIDVDRIYPNSSPQWPYISMQDSFKLTEADSIYELCHKDSFSINPWWPYNKIYHGCIMYPDFTRNKSFDQSELNDFISRNYFVNKYHHILKLIDTVFVKQDGAPGLQSVEPEWSISEPGKYRVVSRIKNLYGCSSYNYAEVISGHYADFTADDEIVCFEKIGSTVTLRHDVSYFWRRFMPFEPDVNPNEFWVDPLNTTGIIGYPNDQKYGNRDFPPTIAEKVDWNFGDGTGWHTNAYGTDSIFVTYNLPGDYTISMRTTDSNGCVQILEKKDFIKILDVEADFGPNMQIEVCSPVPVSFTDSSRNINVFKNIYNSSGQVIGQIQVDSIRYWEWKFTNNFGNTSYSYLKNPVNTFVRNGKYDVRLIVENSNGCRDTITKTDVVEIVGPQPRFWIYNDGYKSFVDTICAGQSITVLDSSETTTNWIFEKGDGTIYSDSIRPANHLFNLQYQTPGVYTLKLKASTKVFYPVPAPGYWDYCTQLYGDTSIYPDDPTFTIVVRDNAKASYTATPTSGKKPLKVYFTNTSSVTSGTITGYKWYFGDGQTSTLKDPIHDYITEGKYSVSLVVDTDNGCSDSIYNMQYVDVISALNEISNTPPIIYPNPTTTELTVEHELLIKEISIIDELGKVVLLKTDINLKTYHFEQLKLEHGTYMIKIIDVNGNEYYSKLSLL